MHSRRLLPWYDLCSCTTSILSHSWKIPRTPGMISLQRRCKKHHQNQVFSIKGAYFWKNKPQSPILRGFGEDSYALLCFTGQQYFKNNSFLRRMFVLSVESYHIFTILLLYLWMSAKFGLYWSLFNTSCMGCLQSIKFRIQPALAKSKTSVSRYLQHAAAAGYKPAPQLGRYLQFITQNLYTFSKALFYLSCFILLYK